MSEALLEWIRAHGAAGVFVFIAVENLGIPWPTELAFIVAVDLVRTGRLTYLEAIILITAAHLTGSCIGYGIGRAGDNFVVRRLRRNRHMQRAREWLQTWYARHGAITVFAARLIGQVRPWASIAAGLGKVGVLPLVVFTTLGSAVYAILAVELTRVGFRFWDAYPHLRLALIITVFAIFYGAAIYAVVRGIMSRRRRGSATGTDDQPETTPPQ